ncbi:MAG: 30S ribosomal protein S3 [Planctomycetota bacterium]|nr:30S ribosomal protein S3 [Planctomycetota bacterium]
MGQKTNPVGFRTGVYLDWTSRWYAPKKDFARLLKEDREIRSFIRKEFYGAGIPQIEIERKADALRVIVHTAKPGVLIGRKGVKAEELKKKIEGVTGRRVGLDILEIPRPELNATLVAQNVAEQLQKRAAYRRTLKRSVQQTMERGAKGVKIVIGGRLGGAEIARTEKQSQGSIPLSTLRANISYGTAEARTTYGVIGVKCWIYLGTLPKAEPKAKTEVL